MADKQIHRPSIETNADLALRCKLHDDCWIWQGYTDDRDRIHLWFQGQVTSMGQVIGFLRTGKRPLKVIWKRGCSTDLCCNPEHWGPISRSVLARQHPSANEELRKLKVAAASRANAKITPEIAREIQQSSESTIALGKRHGISQAHAWRIKTGKSWAPPKTLISSVFTFGATL